MTECTECGRLEGHHLGCEAPNRRPAPPEPVVAEPEPEAAEEPAEEAPEPEPQDTAPKCAFPGCNLPPRGRSKYCVNAKHNPQTMQSHKKKQMKEADRG